MTRASASALPIILAVIAGAVLWELARGFTTRRDVFDGALYWTAIYPAAIVLSFGFGLIWRERPWRWPALLMAGQFVWSLGREAIRSGMPTLFPLTFVMFAVLSLPCIAMAYAGKWLGDRFLR